MNGVNYDSYSYDPASNEAVIAFGFDPEDPQQQEWIEALNLQPYVRYTIVEVQQALANVMSRGDLDASARAVHAFERFRVHLIQWLEQQLEKMNVLASEHGSDAVFALEVDWEGNLYSMNVLDAPQSSE